jgi:hypothetical protein
MDLVSTARLLSQGDFRISSLYPTQLLQTTAVFLFLMNSVFPYTTGMDSAEDAANDIHS